MDTCPPSSPDKGPCGCPCRTRVGLIALGVVVIVFAFLHFLPQWIGHESSALEAPVDEAAPGLSATHAFDGPSADLKQTVVVPTLDTPMPAGKNVIWCGTFQMAWNRLRDDVIKEPIRIRGAEDVTAQLNTAPLKESDLPPGSFYAAAGKVADDVLGTVRSDMAERFPGKKLPRFTVDPNGLFAYAYLKTDAKFTQPFWDHDDSLTFTDSAGGKAEIRTFGMYEGPGYAPQTGEAFDQIQVLYAKAGPAAAGKTPPLVAFAADLCRMSKPNQLILAVVEPQATLAATWQELKKGMRTWKPDQFEPFDGVLEVPNLNWKVTHAFAELTGEDKTIENAPYAGYFIREAIQMIDFRLDKGGATLESEAEIAAAADKPETPRKPQIRLVYDRPFLIVMRQRGHEEPFFMMWVDNAELLVRPEK
jgi:hypothetical protein